jgi:hypothetical protein
VAARLKSALAGGVWSNVEYATTQPVWEVDDQVAAEDQRGREEPPDLRLRVDLVLGELDEHPRALRVADEDDAAPVVVVREVVAPRIANVAVRECRRSRGGAPADRPQRQLAVHRRVDPAHLGEAGRLRDRDAGLGGIDVQVRVHRRLGADGRVDVEAVDGLLRGSRVLDVAGSVGGDERGVAARRARVVGQPRTAEPHGVRRGGGIRPARRGRRGGARGRRTDRARREGEHERGHGPGDASERARPWTPWLQHRIPPGTVGSSPPGSCGPGEPRR